MSSVELLSREVVKNRYNEIPPPSHASGKLGKCCCISLDSAAGIALVISSIAIIGGTLAFTGVIPMIGSAIGFWLMVGGAAGFAISFAALIAFTTGSVKTCLGGKNSTTTV